MITTKEILVSFVFIIIGIYFMFGPYISVTGAYIGVVENDESYSNVLAGLLFLWIAAIIIIGASSKKLEDRVLNLDTIDKRNKEIRNFLSEQDFEITKSFVNEVKKKEEKGTKLYELSGEERADIAKNVIDKSLESYIKFLGLKSKGNNYGKTALYDWARRDADVNEEDYQNITSLTSEGIAKTSSKQRSNLALKLKQYSLSELYSGPKEKQEKHRKALVEELAKYHGIDKNKIKTLEDIQRLLYIKEEKEASKKQIEQQLKQYTPKKAA